jgi:hypothetical protein
MSASQIRKFSTPQALDHLVDGVLLALDMSFDMAVRSIADPAADAELISLLT